ncbi:hypothetical protein [Dyella lutea]|uniref:Uncharacterized protein n=1 Tax=Dyella lutea TaxID=2950441 RepID=A0ABT1FDA5_9GAMM|nr:hypothetical protein [Dyella lutea]MCP1375361.1 hypothetical protein [Dyella lutea]
MSSEETPRVTFRFFKVTEGPLIEELNKIFDEQELAFDAAREIAKAVGATAPALYCRSWLFQFEEAPPEATWKCEHRQGTERYYKPIRRSLVGRKWADEIKRLKVPRHHNDALSVVDLTKGPAVVEGRHWYAPVVWGWIDGPLFLVKVPWRAYAPEILDAYRAMRDAGEYGSGAMDHALWVPHPTMQEIEEWEALKIAADRKAAAA